MGLALLGAAMVAASCAEISPDELAERYRPSDVDTPGTLPPPSTTLATVDPDDIANTPSTDGRPPRATPLEPSFGGCPFEPGPYDVECGTILIPEEDDDAVLPIEIAFARFRATDPDPAADPVVYLHGGPGGAILLEAGLFARAVVDPFIARRDVILYDQRGAGQSSPLPECFEAWDLDDGFYSSNTPHDDLRSDYTELLTECADRVGGRDTIDFTEYASATHADDFVDLVRALGYEQVNVYGNSYGTRLAQTILRDHPEPVRSVILSGVYPIEANLVGATPSSFESGFQAIAAACAATPSCDRELPDPVGSLQAQVVALDQDPPTFEVPFDDQTSYPFVLAGDDLINILHGLLYSIDGAALIPDLLIDLEAGDRSRLERIAPDGIYNTSDVGGYLGVQCREEAPFTTPDELDRASRSDTIWDRINLPPGLLSSDLIEVCAAWEEFGVADPSENDPVTWDQPTLILSGGFDPITPPVWAEAVAARLPNAALAFSPDRGHDADEGPCAAGLMTEFVETADATLDTSCTLDFPLPYITATNVREQNRNRIELSESIFDIDPGPDTDWIDMLLPDWVFDFYDDEEAYWRNLDVYDSTLIVVRAGSFSPDELTFYLPFETLKVDFVSTERPSSVSPGWTRSVYDTVSYDIVSYQTTGTPLMNISVIALPDDLDVLETDAVIPMVNSVVLG
ncbi:MAG: alpha/beta fold hydrolase [Actinomycetota bacterium]